MDVFSQPLGFYSRLLFTVCVFNFNMDVFVLLANVLRTQSRAVPKSAVNATLGAFFLAIFFFVSNFEFSCSRTSLEETRILDLPGYRHSTVQTRS
jgi:hypothetical protein